MRAFAVAAFLAGCGFAPYDGATVVEDRAGFTGTLTGGSTTSRGAIEPETYYVGGLHARGFHNEGVTRTTTSADLDTLFRSPSGDGIGVPLTAWGDDPASGYPHGLGLANHDHWSVVFDGEVWLPEGTSSYVLGADDAGFVEITIDGTIAGVHADYTGSGAIDLTTPRAGWYPIVGAVSESVGNASLILVETAPENLVVPPARLRSRTTDVRGAAAYLFYLQELEYGPALWFDHGPIDHDAFTPGPGDYNLSSTFSLRWAGQLLIDKPGSYLIGATTGPDADDTFRLFLDGKLVANHWLTLVDQQTATLDLAAGWHAFALDYGNNTNVTSIHFGLGDAGAQRLQSIRADHLRPAVAWGVPISAVGGGAVNWADGQSNTYPMKLAAAGGETIDTVDLQYSIAGPRNVTATLDQGGTLDTVVIRDTANETDFAPNLYDYDALRPGFTGEGLGSDWRFTVSDPIVDGAGGSTVAVVMVGYHGGPLAPFSDAMTYVSEAHETPGAHAIDRAVVTGDLAGANLVVSLRTADDPAQLESEPWLATTAGMPPARRYIQYRLEITSDGWAFPSIERVELDFH